jgi:plastocyanin
LKRGATWIAVALFPLVATTGHAEPGVHFIDIAKMAFGQVPADVHVGDKIVWRNKDMFRHTVTARDGSFDFDIAVGAEAQTLVKTAGPLAFYCRFHPTMVGVVTVQP